MDLEPLRQVIEDLSKLSLFLFILKLTVMFIIIIIIIIINIIIIIIIIIDIEQPKLTQKLDQILVLAVFGDHALRKSS